MNRSFKLAALVVLAVVGLPQTVHADIVWPALMLEVRSLAWYSIVVGLLVEILIIRWLFQLPKGRAIWVTFVANLISTIVGLPLVPILGVGWEVIADPTVNRAMGWGTFNPVTWTATCILATVANTVVEALVYKNAFRLKIHRRELKWIFFANALSVGLAYVSLFAIPLNL